MQFRDGDKMLSTIQEGRDLYNPEKEIYVFLYNDLGSICVYSNITKEYAAKLDKEGDEYWGAYMGPGGSIYDSEQYILENEGDDALLEAQNLGLLNHQWCNYNYACEWLDVTK